MVEELEIRKQMVEFYTRTLKRLPVVPPARPFEVRVDVQQFDTKPFPKDDRPGIVAEPSVPVLGPPKAGISSVVPNRGLVDGGTFVTINGSQFIDGAVVFFDDVEAGNITFVDDTKLTCTTPAHVDGPVNVKVQNIRDNINTEDILNNGYTFFSYPHHYTLIGPINNTDPNGPDYVYSNNYYSYELAAYRVDGSLNIYWSGSVGFGWYADSEMSGLSVIAGGSWSNGVIYLTIALFKTHLTPGTQTSVSLYPWDQGPIYWEPVGIETQIIQAPIGYTIYTNKGSRQGLQLYYDN